MYIYVIYKPWQLGVYNKYMTQVRGQKKFAIDKPRAQGQGSYVCFTYCNGRGSYDEVILVVSTYIIQQKPVTMFSTHSISLPSDSAAF